MYDDENKNEINIDDNVNEDHIDEEKKETVDEQSNNEEEVSVVEDIDLGGNTEEEEIVSENVETSESETSGGAQEEKVEETVSSKEESLRRERDITMNNVPKQKKEKKPKKERHGASIALVIIFCMIFSLLSSGGAYYLAKKAYEQDKGEEVVMYTSVVRYTSDSTQTSQPLTSKQVTALTQDSVVEIRTEIITTGQFMSQYVSEGAGSGVIVSSNGYIATNYHVIDGASKITVTLKDGTEYVANYVAGDEEADLAVLKIEASDLKAVIFGDSSTLGVGESVIAIGNPLGELGGSVTMGIISALDREISIDSQVMTLLQTDAAVNPGNSGGGLFNMYGELVGIVNAKSYGEEIDGIGFAIPSNTAKTVISDLINYGYVKGRVRLGVSMIDINSNYYARYYGVTELGTYIYSVGENSMASELGLRSGDRLVSINGVEITSASVASSVIKSLTVGDEITVTVMRGYEEITVSMFAVEYVPTNAQ